MPEPTTETTQPTETTTTPPVTTTPEPEQGAAGATTTPAPSQTSTEQTTQPTTTTPATTQPTKISPEETQKRINRMYARLQEERRQRLAAEARAKVQTAQTAPVVDEGGEGEETPTSQGKTLTEADVVAVVERQERDKKFVQSEIAVFEQHPDALNEDGSFNMNSTFVQKYIEIGRRNPMLAMMENGPELAAAMADKELGIDYKKGRKDEATRPAPGFTTSSTTAPAPAATTTELSSAEKKIARRMGLTDAEYSVQKSSNKVIQKSWEVKPK